MDSSKVAVGLRIMLVRGNLGREEFAQSVCSHRNSISRYEKGTASPSMELMAQICQVYNISSDWLLFGTGPKYRGEPQQPAKTAENGNGSHLNRFEDSLITDIRNFMNELGRKDPDWRTWFKMELLDKIPKFRDWWEAKHPREGEDISNKSNAA